jgi:peptidoglycan/xylan/chitin deacetylase (PgdA/CDA1 family)
LRAAARRLDQTRRETITFMAPSDRVTVLMYHDVGPAAGADGSKYCVTPARFAAQMRALADRGYRAIPIDRLLAWLEGGPELAEGDFVLTFDDGFLGVREHALPVLAELDWPCAVFLVTRLLGKTDDWVRNDGARAGRRALLSEEDVRALQSHACSFHSHTCTHASLTRLDDAQLALELRQSRADLVRLLGDRSYCLAYPYGHVDERVERAARMAGYRAGFSVTSGFNRLGVNPFRVRRLDVFGTDSPAALLRKIRLGDNDGSAYRFLTYKARRAWQRIARTTA